MAVGHYRQAVGTRVTPDQAKDAYYRETKQMAVKMFAIARWDRLSVER